jgi:flagellar basal body-associated protein FliL
MDADQDLEKSTKDEDEKDKEVEPLELDKLDVSSMTIPPPKLPGFEGKRDEAEVVSPSRLSTFTSILVFVSKERIFICAFLLGLSVASAVVYLFLTNSSSDGVDSGDSYVGSLVYVVSSSIAERHYVRFRLSIPFKDNKEKADLMQKLPAIKQELSISGSSSAVAQSIEKKDLKTLKKHILKIVNELTGVPIEVLHLEELTLDPTVGKAPYNTS